MKHSRFVFKPSRLVGLAAVVVSLAAAGAIARPDEKKPDPAKPVAPAPAPAKAEEPKKDAPKPDAAKPEKPAVKEAHKEAAVDAQVLSFNMKDIDGKDVNLAQYKGKVVLMVNVASKCGYTPQYKGLEKLYRDNKDKGFVILGFPANNFGGQEPGTDKEIKAYCSSTYDVTFPMFSKISVKGEDQNALYKKLAGQPKPIGGDPQWNFTKFLVDKSGNVVARFDSNVKPEDTKLKAKITELLDQK